MCRETLDHLAFLKDKVKDVEGFWASTMVSLIFGTWGGDKGLMMRSLLAQARPVEAAHHFQIRQGRSQVLDAYRARPGP